MAKGKTFHIYPVPGVSIPPQEFTPPIRAKEQDVDADTWKRVQEFNPPAFTLSPPAASADADGPSTDVTASPEPEA